MIPMEERRQYPRCVARIEAEYEVEGSTDSHPALVRDLSACGVGLHTREPLAPLTTLTHFKMGIEDAHGRYLLDTTAVVVRSEIREAGDDDAGYFSGIQFLDLAPEVVERVRSFVLARLLGGG